MSHCDKTHPHTPHWWCSATEAPFDGLQSCPGTDVEPHVLAPERDRPEPPEFDWTPESLFLSDAAAIVVRAHMTGPGNRPSPSYYGAIMVWRELTGLGEPEALTYAYQIATAHPPVTAVVPPF